MKIHLLLCSMRTHWNLTGLDFCNYCLNYSTFIFQILWALLMIILSLVLPIFMQWFLFNFTNFFIALCCIWDPDNILSVLEVRCSQQCCAVGGRWSESHCCKDYWWHFSKTRPACCCMFGLVYDDCFVSVSFLFAFMRESRYCCSAS